MKRNESLLLKWGTIKGWKFDEDGPAFALLQKYADIGMAMGAMQQQDTPEQKRLICDIIDAVDGQIQNDWTGKIMTKDEAKKYVIEYGT